MIKILYFASLRERLGTAEETLDAAPPTLTALRELLAARGDAWSEVFGGGKQPVLAAVNQEMAAADQVLGESDEVGFFPPVTGG